MFRLSDYEIWSHKAETGIRDMNRMIIIKQTDIFCGQFSKSLIRVESLKEGQNMIRFIPMEGWLQLKWHWISELKYLQLQHFYRNFEEKKCAYLKILLFVGNQLKILQACLWNTFSLQQETSIGKLRRKRMSVCICMKAIWGFKNLNRYFELISRADFYW